MQKFSVKVHIMSGNMWLNVGDNPDHHVDPRIFWKDSVNAGVNLRWKSQKELLGGGLRSLNDFVSCCFPLLSSFYSWSNGLSMCEKLPSHISFWIEQWAHFPHSYKNLEVYDHDFNSPQGPPWRVRVGIKDWVKDTFTHVPCSMHQVLTRL